MRALPFGIALPGVQRIPGRAEPWERDVDGRAIVRVARAAEAAGCSWVSCSDHPLVPASRASVMGEVWFDAGSTLAFVAGATEGIRLLAHVLVAPYRHPLLVAKQWGTLDLLSGGRVVLGVGAGHVKPEFRILGAEYERRGVVTDETIMAVAAAWTETPASFEGTAIRFRDVVVAPMPAQRPRPPIWVGGNSAAAVRRDVDTLRGLAERFRELRCEAGRPEPGEVVVPVGIPDDVDAGALHDRVARWIDAGATGIHLGVRARSLEHFVERVGWLGETLRDVAIGAETA